MLTLGAPPPAGLSPGTGGRRRHLAPGRRRPRHEHGRGRPTRCRKPRGRSQARRILDRDGDFRIIDRTVEVYGRLLGQAREKHVRRAVKDLHRDGVVANDGMYEFYRRPLGPVMPPGQRTRESPGFAQASRPTSGPRAAARRPSGSARPTA